MRFICLQGKILEFDRILNYIFFRTTPDTLAGLRFWDLYLDCYLVVHIYELFRFCFLPQSLKQSCSILEFGHISLLYFSHHPRHVCRSVILRFVCWLFSCRSYLWVLSYLFSSSNEVNWAPVAMCTTYASATYICWFHVPFKASDVHDMI